MLPQRWEKYTETTVRQVLWTTYRERDRTQLKFKLLRMNPTLMGEGALHMLISSWATTHIANWFYDGIPISSWYQSELSSCEAKWPHALYVTPLLSTCRLENLSHVRRRVESCPTSVRDKVCYVLIWSWATPHIANWFYGGTPISNSL